MKTSTSPNTFSSNRNSRTSGFTYHLRRFEGAHEWAPADVWLEAFAWFSLQAMKSGTLPKDDKFIADAYSHALATAARSEKRPREVSRLLADCQDDFADSPKPPSLKNSPPNWADPKPSKIRPNANSSRQTNNAVSQLPFRNSLRHLKIADQRPAAMLQLRQLFADLKAKAQNNKDPQQMVAKRVRTQEFIHAYENGMQMIGKQGLCERPIGLRRDHRQCDSGSRCPSSEVKDYLLTGDKSKALIEARLAVKDGVNDPANFSEPEFGALKSNPEFGPARLLAS